LRLPSFFKDGKYYYSDPNYSIFDIPVEEKELLKEVFMILLKERENLTVHEMDTLLKRLSEITGEEIPQKPTEDQDETEPKLRSLKPHKMVSRNTYYSKIADAEEDISPLDKAIRSLASRREEQILYWGYVLEVL